MLCECMHHLASGIDGTPHICRWQREQKFTTTVPLLLLRFANNCRITNHIGHAVQLDASPGQ